MTETPTAIQGVRLIQPKRYEDARGAFSEVFRASWMQPHQRWVQWNLSRSKANVLRGLHFHRKQTDYWLPVEGHLRAAVVDLRQDSPTFRAAQCIELSSDDPHTLVIPPGVAHGFRAVTNVTLMYLLDEEYDATDEFGVFWADRDLKLPAIWYDGPEPLISPRDATAPKLIEVLERM